MDEWYRAIARRSGLSSETARQLRDVGFVVLPGAVKDAKVSALADAYDAAVASADPADVSVRSSTRVSDFVNRGPAFDDLYVYEPLLAACAQIAAGPRSISRISTRRSSRARAVISSAGRPTSTTSLVGATLSPDRRGT